jgi:hypothetical protein
LLYENLTLRDFVGENIPVGTRCYLSDVGILPRHAPKDNQDKHGAGRLRRGYR